MVDEVTEELAVGSRSCQPLYGLVSRKSKARGEGQKDTYAHKLLDLTLLHALLKLTLLSGVKSAQSGYAPVVRFMG